MPDDPAIDVDRLRVLVAAASRGSLSGVVELGHAAARVIEPLLRVFEAAATWRDERCSRFLRFLGCDPRDGSHDDACDVLTNMRRLCAAVDAARGVG